MKITMKEGGDFEIPSDVPEEFPTFLQELLKRATPQGEVTQEAFRLLCSEHKLSSERTRTLMIRLGLITSGFTNRGVVFILKYRAVEAPKGESP